MTTTPSQKRYKVKDADAVFVAGVRIEEDRTVLLFEEAARYELLAETIEEAGVKSQSASKVAKQPVEA